MRAVNVKAINVKEAGETFNSALQDAARSVQRLRHSAEDAIEEARHGVATRPLSIVAGVAAAGVVLGFVAGWFLGKRPAKT